jgi:hypothetical protein
MQNRSVYMASDLDYLEFDGNFADFCRYRVTGN